MEVSFHDKIASLKLGEGDTFHGEGMLAVTKALLQSGVSYVGGYQGAPISHLLDVMVQARDCMQEFGVHVEPCTSEAAEGECQLERQRRIRPINAAALRNGERVVRTRFGVDDDTCNGDHACVRLSGCPSLTIQDSSDPLKVDPVAHVNNDCVGCGLCGEVAHAAVLCPSFFRAKIVQNTNAWDRFADRLRSTVIGRVQPA